jgi:murein DD-endopeptidase MepM/ murein hydrolase activator NlpD
MLRIEITIPRPRAAVLWLVGAVAFGFWLRWVTTPNAPVDLALGGAAPTTADERSSVEAEARTARAEVALISRQEEILRYELSVLEAEEARQPGDPVLVAGLQRARTELLRLLDDRQAAETRIAETIAAFQEAAGIAARISERSEVRDVVVSFQWPIKPALGISAGFREAAYAQRFGMEHQGIDLPTEHGTVIRAPADAVVARVSARGLGYSSLVLSHAGGYATLFGHVSTFLVSEGQTVRAGEAVARTGGTPGTPGAGLFTTGAHLHFEVLKNGQHIDPITVLPSV